MSEIQPLQLVDISESSDNACGPNGCGCGSAEISTDESLAASAPVQA